VFTSVHSNPQLSNKPMENNELLAISSHNCPLSCIRS